MSKDSDYRFDLEGRRTVVGFDSKSSLYEMEVYGGRVNGGHLLGTIDSHEIKDFELKYGCRLVRIFPTSGGGGLLLSFEDVGRDISDARYLSAVGLVKAYHSQVGALIDNSDKTLLKDWWSGISTRDRDGRLATVLGLSRPHIMDPLFDHVEDVRRDEFMLLRGAGKRTWVVFVELLGRYPVDSGYSPGVFE